MKPSVASFLSISSIVIAGGAALAVNATVFDAPTSSAAAETPEVLMVPNTNAEGQVAMTEIQLGGLGTTDEVAIQESVPAAPTLAPATTIATAAGGAAVTSLSEYEIPSVGVVTVAQTGTVISIAKVTANAGYTYATSEPFPGRLDVKFVSTTKEIEFDAQFIDGRIVTAIRSRALGLSTAGTASSSHDDDEGEHEDHDDDEHEDHDEEDDD